MTHVVPPVLHIMLGLTVRFYKEVEGIARRADGEELFTNEGMKPDDRVFKEWEEQTGKVKDLERDVEGMREELEYRESMLEGFEKSRESKSGKGLSDKCAMPACALEKHKVSGVGGNVDWVKCVECEDDVDEDDKMVPYRLFGAKRCGLRKRRI